jgi:hypothetical protein
MDCWKSINTKNESIANLTIIQESKSVYNIVCEYKSGENIEHKASSFKSSRTKANNMFNNGKHLIWVKIIRPCQQN